jgi:hypothetical protein
MALFIPRKRNALPPIARKGDLVMVRMTPTGEWFTWQQKKLEKRSALVNDTYSTPCAENGTRQVPIPNLACFIQFITMMWWFDKD